MTGAEDVVGTHDDAVKCVEYDQESGMIISGGWDNKLKAWDARLPTERRCVADIQLPGKVYSMSLSPESVDGRGGGGGRKLVVAMSGRDVHVYTPVGLTLGGKKRDGGGRANTRGGRRGS